MKIKTIIIGVVILPIFLFALAKGGMEYKAKGFMSDIITNAAPQDIINYRNLETDVRGQTRINEISIRPNKAKTPITIDQIVISGPGPVSYITNDYISGTDIPSKIHVYWDSIHIPAEHQFLKDLLKSIQKQYNIAQNSEIIEDDGCLLGTLLFHPKVMQEIGFKEYVIDAIYQHSFNSSTHVFYTKIEINIKKIASISIALDLDSINPEAIADRDYQTLIKNTPALTSFDMTYYIDKEYANKYKTYCASLQGVTESQFTQLLYLDQKLALAKAGIKLGNGLKRTLKKYLSEWGEMRVTVKPKEPFPFTGMLFGINDDALKNLNIEFSLNDNLLTNTHFTYKPPTKTEIKEIKDAKIALTDNKKYEIIRYETQFVEVPLPQIDQYKGQIVRIMAHQKITNKLRPIIGRYVDTIESYIRLKVKVGGSGRMIMPTAKKRITKVEVLKKVQVKYDEKFNIIK